MGFSNYTVSYILLLLYMFSFSAAVHIENNGYTNIVISFSPSINPRDIDFSKLKEIFQNASELLFEATRRRSYFSGIVVAIPQSWDGTLCNEFSKSSTFIPKNSTVFVQESSSAHVCHSGKCGERGQVIFVPSEWFAPTQQNVEGIARVFVKLWATFRYGVFEEEPLTEGSCFTSSGQSWSPTGCYNVRFNSTLNIDSTGLPQCDFNKDSSSISKATSSLMFSTEYPDIKHFCDDSADFLHSPIAQTRHNILCNRKPVWNVIKDNEDFKFGRNRPVKNNAFKPLLSFQCYQERRQSFIFIVQNASLTSVSQTVKEIRLSLLRFLLFSVPSDTHVTVATFSDEIHTTKVKPVVLDLTKPDETKASLKWNIRAIDNITDVCISCGLKKAIEVIKTSANSPAAVVLLTLASAAENMKPDAFLEAFQTLEEKLYFVVIEDKEGSTVPGSVIRTIQSKGGLVFFLPSNLVMLNVKLNVIFSSLMRSSLQLTDRLIVVHEATFINATSSISDAFSVSDDIQGKLLYTFKCNNGDLLDFDNSGCDALADVKDAGQECGIVTELKPTNETKRTWDFHYTFLGGPQQFLMCSSLATVLLSKDDAVLTVNGWLSDYEVTPGAKGLVIHAQVLNNFSPLATADVEAVIARPRLNKGHDSVILELRDNGNGDPDGKKGDGIFSRYFSSFTTKGIYTVSVRVRTTFQNTGYDGFHRMTTVGSFLVTEDPPAMDVYPPNRIADLSIVEVDHENSTVTLQWTAPGDDYDMGQVESYEAFYSENWQDMTDSIISQASANHLRPSFFGKEKKKTSGNLESKQYSLPMLNMSSLHYISIRGCDKVGNTGKLSNLIQLFIYPPSVRPVKKNMTCNYSTEIETQTEPLKEKIVFVNQFDKYHIVLISACGIFLLLLIIVAITLCIIWKKRKNMKCSQCMMKNPQPLKEVDNTAYSIDDSDSRPKTNCITHEETQLYKVISKKSKKSCVATEGNAEGENAQVEKDLGLV